MNIDDVKNLWGEGEQMEYLFFYGYSGPIGCYSQWSWHSFEVDGERYQSAEQFMMAQKALLFNDRNAYMDIMRASHPKEYKAIGRRIKHFNQPLWDGVKTAIVFDGNMAKFSQNKGIKKKLLSTGDKILVEASPYDRIWGIGLSADTPGINNPYNWQGENLLGFVLMDVRDVLLAGDYED